MNLRIGDISCIDKNVREVLFDHCNKASRIISEHSRENPHETIHEVRKIFKKIRGVLRLVRDTTDQYQSWNTFFRDEARKISDIRDTTSMMEAIDLLYDQYGDKLYKNAFSRIRTKLDEIRLRQKNIFLVEENVLQEINERIILKCDDLKKLSIEIDSFHDVLPGVKRTYKRGRKAFKKAAGTKSPEDFHEWRKRVKYLRYQLRTIYHTWPLIWEAWEDELHDLSDCLGNDRDLFMLQNFLKEYPLEESSQNNEGSDIDLLNTLIDGHRPMLQYRSLLLGQKLYQLKPGKFISLVEAAWDSQLAMETDTMHLD